MKIRPLPKGGRESMEEEMSMTLHPRGQLKEDLALMEALRKDEVVAVRGSSTEAYRLTHTNNALASHPAGIPHLSSF